MRHCQYAAAVCTFPGDLLKGTPDAGSKPFLVFRQSQRIGFRDGFRQQMPIRTAEGRLKSRRIGKTVLFGQLLVQHMGKLAFKAAEAIFAQIGQLSDSQAALPCLLQYQTGGFRGTGRGAGEGGIKRNFPFPYPASQSRSRSPSFVSQRRIAPSLQAADGIENGFAVPYQINFQHRIIP